MKLRKLIATGILGFSLFACGAPWDIAHAQVPPWTAPMSVWLKQSSPNVITGDISFAGFGYANKDSLCSIASASGIGTIAPGFSFGSFAFTKSSTCPDAGLLGPMNFDTGALLAGAPSGYLAYELYINNALGTVLNFSTTVPAAAYIYSASGVENLTGTLIMQLPNGFPN